MSERSVSSIPTRGGHSSIDLSYSMHRQHLVRFAVQFVDDFPSAEDVVHDVFARLTRLNSAGHKTDGEYTFAYLRTAVLNECRSVLRKRRLRRGLRWTRSEQLDIETSDPTEVMDQVLRLLDTLPPRQKEVVVLRYFEDITVSEVSDALKISPGAVSASASIALRSIYLRLGGNGA